MWMWLMCLGVADAGEVTLRGKLGTAYDGDGPEVIRSGSPFEMVVRDDGTWLKRLFYPCSAVEYEEPSWSIGPRGVASFVSGSRVYEGRVAHGRALLLHGEYYPGPYGELSYYAMHLPGSPPFEAPLLYGTATDGHIIEARLFDGGECWFHENWELLDGHCRSAWADLCTWSLEPVTGLPTLVIDGLPLSPSPIPELGCLRLDDGVRTMDVCAY